MQEKKDLFLDCVAVGVLSFTYCVSNSYIIFSPFKKMHFATLLKRFRVGQGMDQSPLTALTR